MNITSPIQPNVNQPVEKGDSFLKVNQRVAGEILNISNDQVVLSINGVQIVAKMTSSEQLAMLMERRYAYFVVKDVSDKVVTLQLANVDQNVPQKQAIATSLNTALLEQLGLPVDQKNLTIVEAAFNRGLKITPELMDELRSALELSPGWGSREAQLAAAIKSSGLPLTQGSLSLAESAIKDFQHNYTNLIDQLETAIYRMDLSESSVRLLRTTLNSLKGLIIQSGDTTQQLETELLNSIKYLGTSVENNLSQLTKPELRDTVAERLSNSILNLVNLQKELSNSGNDKLGKAINNFLEGIKWSHFQNAEVDHPIGKGQWTQIDLPLNFGSVNPFQGQAQSIHDLKIRIAHDTDEDNSAVVNPEYTRLVIQVDLNPQDIIRVDLSIVSKQIGAEISATNKDICMLASEELSELQTGLSNLGYTLKTSRIELGRSFLEMDMNENSSPQYSFSSIDLGV